MLDQFTQRSWWKQVLIGSLAIAFGISAIVMPAGIIINRMLDSLFGVAKPLSASMTAVAVMLALVALVAVDGLVNLFGTGVVNQPAARLRGTVGVATAVAAIVWPGGTAFIAVELIGLWAIAIGVLELFFAKYSGDGAKNRALYGLAAIASIVLGIGIMRWAFVGALAISATVGIAAMARGISLIITGVSNRSHPIDGQPAAA